ncbi:MAG: sensor histidine kinase [Clostridia bacterium]|nr:sensor histidine kinase [Clostridia bacterium]
MSLGKWLLDKKVYFILHLGLMFLVVVFMSVYGMNGSSVIFVSMIFLLVHISYLIYEYMRRYKFYKRIDEALESLDHKHYVHELMEEPYFFEGIFLQEVIQAANKSMNDVIGNYKIRERDYRDYIETWVHEIKTPIAAGQLIIKNNKSTVTNSLKEEFERIEGYVEQALYYARGHQLEKDYIIKDVSLKVLTQETLKKYASKLIAAKCQIEIFEEDIHVKTDEKWMAFIIGQLLNNALQYKKSPMVLKFAIEKSKDQVIFKIHDNGIGIKPEDLTRVFDKGFTGTNGRQIKQSTGIGLYLCKSLAVKMGLMISIQSKEEVFTEVSIVFPISSMYT